MKRQKQTNPDTAEEWAPSPQQQAAVDLLASGRTVTEAAEAVGVARQTTSEWLHQHHGFRIALNQRRQELWSAMAERLRNLVPKALDVIERELTDAGDLHAAVTILKAVGLHDVGPPSGATTLEDARIEDAEREGQRSMRVVAAAAFQLKGSGSV